jgi:hypothetical protein
LKAAREEILCEFLPASFCSASFRLQKWKRLRGAVLSPYGCPAVRTKNNKISAQTIARIIRLPMKRFVVISTGASAESV